MTGQVWLDVALGAVIALAATWLALVIALLLVRPRGGALGQALRLLPDLLRLLRRLAADKTQPAGVRIRLALLLVYLASPIDLVPDFIPVLGYADDAIVVVLTLRAVARRVGTDALRANWPGTDDGFAALCRLTGLPRPSPHR